MSIATRVEDPEYVVVPAEYLCGVCGNRLNCDDVDRVLATIRELGVCSRSVIILATEAGGRDPGLVDFSLEVLLWHGSVRVLSESVE